MGNFQLGVDIGAFADVVSCHLFPTKAIRVYQSVSHRSRQAIYNSLEFPLDLPEIASMMLIVRRKVRQLKGIPFLAGGLVFCDFNE